MVCSPNRTSYIVACTNKVILLSHCEKDNCQSYLTRLYILTDDYIILSGELRRVVIDVQDSNTNWNVAH